MYSPRLARAPRCLELGKATWGTLVASQSLECRRQNPLLAGPLSIGRPSLSGVLLSVPIDLENWSETATRRLTRGRPAKNRDRIGQIREISCPIAERWATWVQESSIVVAKGSIDEAAARTTRRRYRFRGSQSIGPISHNHAHTERPVSFSAASTP